MHLGTRHDEDRGRTRTVVWTDASQTDLGVLILASVAAVVLAASVLCAVELRGIPRVLAVVVAVVSGTYAAVMILPLLLIFGGVFVVKGLSARSPSAGQRASWVVAAAALGAALGADTYAVGLPGLLTGPIVIAIVAGALGAAPSLSRRNRRRTIELSAIVAAVAFGVGLTIFL